MQQICNQIKLKWVKLKTRRSCFNFYAPNFEEVEGAYWFESVRRVSRVRELC